MAYLASSRRRYAEFLRRYRRSRTALPVEEETPGDVSSHSAERSRRRRYLRRYREWLVPHLGPLLLVFVVSLAGIAIDMVWPLASAYLIDRVILSPALATEVKLERLIVVACAMVALFFTNAGLNWLRSLRLQLLNSKLAFGLRSALYDRLLKLPLSELNGMKTGGILSRLSNDVDHTTGLLQEAVLSPLLSTLRLLVTLGIIFALNWRIATAVLLAIPPVMLLQSLRARRMRPIWRSMSQDRQDIDGRVSEGLSGVRVVRGFGRERREELAFMLGHHTVIRKQMLATRTQRSIATIWDLVLPLTQLTIVCFGGYLVVVGKATIGIIVAFQGYVWRLLDPIMSLANSISQTQRGLAAMERVFDVFEKPEEKPDLPGALEAPSRVEEIRLEHVSFAYRPEVPVISDLDLTVAGGSVVALVGPSGAGKTTLVDLVARFYDPTIGVIRVNGVDLRNIKLKSYRRLLGIVSQDVFLFDGTVRENIAYGRPSAVSAEIVDSARRANAQEFIERLPEGYDTLIGERGVKLSGGQRQRLSIARALLAAPEILIMDEATSNLDSQSEQLIQASMRELLRGRTTFVIAHRLSTVTHADVIVVMGAGRIVERGTHAELMQARGAYFSMVERQRRNPAADDNPITWEGGAIAAQ